MMNTAIMLSLLFVSGIVLMISEGERLFSKSRHYTRVQIPQQCENKGENSSRFPDDKSNKVNLLDFSGGTLGI